MLKLEANITLLYCPVCRCAKLKSHNLPMNLFQGFIQVQDTSICKCNGKIHYGDTYTRSGEYTLLLLVSTCQKSHHESVQLCPISVELLFVPSRPWQFHCFCSGKRNFVFLSANMYKCPVKEFPVKMSDTSLQFCDTYSCVLVLIFREQVSSVKEQHALVNTLKNLDIYENKKGLLLNGKLRCILINLNLISFNHINVPVQHMQAIQGQTEAC